MPSVRSLLVVLITLMTIGCSANSTSPPVDEAMAIGKTAADFPTHSANPFPGFEPDLTLSKDEIKGRNTWMLWGGGNEAFWDHLAKRSGGIVDLLKLCDARHVARADRFRLLGVIPEPGMTQATRPNEFGLFLDTYISEPGDQPNPDVYGYSSGIVGIRLFPNPNFKKDEWDADRFLNDASYYKDPILNRPYRPAMTCAFCHVSFHPLRPPADASLPEWRNLSPTIGAQYFKFRRVFGYDMPEHSFLNQIFRTANPGTLDTSLVATDGLNNPNAMNSIFGVLERVQISLRAPKERLEGGALVSPVLPKLTLPGDATLDLPTGADRNVPHVLITGADSIGARGALCRVYVNIGEFHQEWLTCHNLMIGLDRQRPFSIQTAKDNSVYWNVTEKRSVNLARYFLAASRPIRLKDAKWVTKTGEPASGTDFIATDRLKRGREVFAENCFVCHSSKQPGYFWSDPANYQRWISDPKYIAYCKLEVEKEDFLENNYLSTDQRYSVSLLKTNACRAFADNAMTGHVWDNFSSDTFKSLHAPFAIEVDHPYDERRYLWEVPPDIGRGYYRAPTLIGIWATAPFLHNNAVGDFPKEADPANDREPDLSVPGRLKVFDDSIEKLLWPEKRKLRNSIARTTTDSSLQIPYSAIPGAIEKVTGYKTLLLFRGHIWVIPLVLVLLAIFLLIAGRRRMSVWMQVASFVLFLAAVASFWIGMDIRRNGVAIGRIPAGTPVNLMANLNGPGALDDPERAQIYRKVLRDLVVVDKKQLTSLDSDEVPNLVPNLLRLNKCPDFVRDKGHYFGKDLSDQDKRCLIEFLKTF